MQRPAVAPGAFLPGMVVLALAALPMLFVGLGAVGLLDPDEPFYAVPACEMLRSGSWLVPIFRGEPWFDKPIFFYWVVLAGFRLLGESEVAARLGSALAGFGGAVAVLSFGRRFASGRITALLAALVLLTSLEYALMARVAVTDMTLTLAITLVMLAAARYLEEGRASQAALAGAAAGLALLTKGPVGALLPGVALLVYALLARRSDLVRRRALAAATAGALLTAGPWYLYMALRHRDLLVGTFLGQGNLGRFLQPEHPAFPLYYAVIFAFGLLPWSGALPAALYEALRPAVRRDERGVGRRPGPLYLVCWFAAAPLVFSLSASKLPSYILPSFPPAALLIAHYWSRALSFEEGVGRGRGARLAALLGVLLATVTAAGLALFSRRPAWLEARAPLLAIGALLLAASLAALAAAWHRRPAWLLVSQPVAAIGALLILVTLVYPRAEPYVSVRPLALDLRRQGIEREVRGAYHVSDVGLDFYFGRDLPRVSDPAALRRLLAEAPPGGVWIVRSRDLAELEADPDLAARAVSRGPYRSAVRFGNATGAAGEGS